MTYLKYDRNSRSWAKGSKVELSPGKQKPIEDLIPATKKAPNGGDIIRNVEGTDAYVVGSMVGPESPEVITLQIEVTSTVNTGTKFETTINESHAVMRDPLALVPANVLRVGDQVQTIYGRGVVRKKTHSDYADDMYQIFLASKAFVDTVVATTEEVDLYRYLANSLAGLSSREHLVFVDGVLSGDWIIQAGLGAQIGNGSEIGRLF